VHIASSSSPVPSPVPVTIFGASGYAGLELASLLASHPAVAVTGYASDNFAGKAVGNFARGPLGAATFERVEAVLEAPAKVAFLATPNEASYALARKLVDRGVCVIDLSGAHRLRDAAAQKHFYGLDLPAYPNGALAYSLPEVARLDPSAFSALSVIANPGCYATAIALALAPVVAAGLVVGAPIVDAASGVSGAGRKATEAYSFTELASDFRSYRALRHQHVPEVQQLIGLEQPIHFVPHLLPVARGILATTHVTLAEPFTPVAIKSLYTARYAGEIFVKYVEDPEEVRLSRVVGTNRCRLSAVLDETGTHLTIFSAIDNLLKGASGQAVQNMNLLLGLPETTGLEALS
jgi:N-acetyl-gamma-glutamyl-phosphate reductase